MSVPAVRAIKQGLAGAHVAVLTPEKLADVWRLVPEVDEVIPFPAPRGRGLLRKLSGMTHVFRVAKLIRGRGFTTGVVFPNSLRTGLEMWLARVPRRVGYPGHARRSALMTEVFREEKPEPAIAPGAHQVFHYLKLAEFVGARAEPDSSFGFPKAGAGRLRDPGQPVRIAVCAGAEYRTRETLAARGLRRGGAGGERFREVPLAARRHGEGSSGGRGDCDALRESSECRKSLR